MLTKLNVISAVEHGVHGGQTVASTFTRQMTNPERDTIRLDIISIDQSVRHHKELWYDGDQQELICGGDNISNNTVDLLTSKEVKDALSESKNRKVSEPDKDASAKLM